MTPFGRPLIKFYLEKNPVITLYGKKRPKRYKKNYKLLIFNEKLKEFKAK